MSACPVEDDAGIKHAVPGPAAVAQKGAQKEWQKGWRNTVFRYRG